MNRAQFRRGISEIIADYAELPLKDWSLADAFLRVTRLGRAQNVLVPYDLLILMRTMFLAEYVVRALDPEFQLLEYLQARGQQVIQTAVAQSELGGPLDRLKGEALMAAKDLPELLGLFLRKLGPDGGGMSLRVHVHELNRAKE